MKLPLLAPAFILPALFAPALQAQDVTDLSGNVSTLNINLTVNETIGGNLITDQKKISDAAKGITYPDFITYDTTYRPDVPPGSALRNPYGWDITKGNNYVEKITSSNPTGTSLIVRAEGSHKIAKTRYTNATLLADLAAAGRITTTRGYRLVAVRFDTPTDFDAVYNTGTHLTAVNKGLYFFAENGPNDPSPVFLGAETDIYDYEQVIDFESYETAEAGKYIDTFTGTDTGFAYDVLSDSYKGISLAEVSVYRPSAPLSYYEMRVGGVFSWKESYSPRQDVYIRAAISGKGLSGPANTYVPVDTNDDDIADSYQPSGLNEAVVTGAVAMATAKQQASLQKYLNALPPVQD